MEENIKLEIMLLFMFVIVATISVFVTIGSLSYDPSLGYFMLLIWGGLLYVLGNIVYRIYYKLFFRHEIRKIVSSEMRNKLWLLFEENNYKSLSTELINARVEQEEYEVLNPKLECIVTKDFPENIIHTVNRLRNNKYIVAGTVLPLKKLDSNYILAFKMKIGFYNTDKFYFTEVKKII